MVRIAIPDGGVPDADSPGVDGNLRLAVLSLHLYGYDQQPQLKYRRKTLNRGGIFQNKTLM